MSYIINLYAGLYAYRTMKVSSHSASNKVLRFKKRGEIKKNGMHFLRMQHLFHSRNNDNKEEMSILNWCKDFAVLYRPWAA